jgi:NTP pyrophosphatase (non-canonical NTP hydrolase)
MSDHVSYSEFVAALVKPGELIRKEMTNEQAHLMHMAIGLAGEVGELLDAIKKNVIYRKPLDRENVVEELGDIGFYLTALHDALNVSKSEAEQENRSKLNKRYSQLCYTDQAAQEREDKQ